MIIQELNFKQSLLRDCTAEHNEALQKVTSLLAALNQNQTDLDIAQQNRHLNGDEYDVDGNIIVPPEERDIFQKIRVGSHTSYLSHIHGMYVCITEAEI
jgi:hypothetical protein